MLTAGTAICVDRITVEYRVVFETTTWKTGFWEKRVWKFKFSFKRSAGNFYWALYLFRDIEY